MADDSSPGRAAAQPRRGIAISVIGAVLLPVWALAHVYLAMRLAPDGPTGAVVGGAIVTLGALVLLHAFTRHSPPRSSLGRILRSTGWVASIWMGFAFLLIVLTLAADLASLLLPHPGVGSLWAIAAVAGGVAIVSALRAPRHVRREIALQRWPAALDGYRIVQISDVHVGPLLGRRFVAAIVDRANALRPDLVVITGDLVDGSAARLAGEVRPLASLAARDGVWFVTGNHEYFSGVDGWLEALRELGIRSLRNEHVAIGGNGDGFDLAGVDDRYARHFGNGHGEDVPRALAGRAANRPVVLLAHNPTAFDEAAAHGVDLQLSGHTHGGQIWPFRYLVRTVVPYVAGTYRRGSSLLYVSRGTGFWGPPMRLFAPAELTEIVVSRGDEALRRAS